MFCNEILNVCILKLKPTILIENFHYDQIEIYYNDNCYTSLDLINFDIYKTFEDNMNFIKIKRSKIPNRKTHFTQIREDGDMCLWYLAFVHASGIQVSYKPCIAPTTAGTRRL